MSRQIRFQHDLEAAVAEVTGEDLVTIRRMGFSSIDLTDDRFDPEPDWLPPSYVDWDELALLRNQPLVEQPRSSIRQVA